MARWYGHAGARSPGVPQVPWKAHYAFTSHGSVPTSCRKRAGYRRSTTPAIAWPKPMHMQAIP
jgi:hypothetical protein